MYIVSQARKDAVWDHRVWGPSKRRAYYRLKGDTLMTVAEAIRQGEEPPRELFLRHITVRALRPQRPGRRPIRWLMASWIKRVEDTYYITIFYFGPDRDFVTSEFSPAGLVHGERIDRMHHDMHLEGDTLVIEAQPDDESEQIDDPDSDDDESMRGLRDARLLRVKGRADDGSPLPALGRTLDKRRLMIDLGALGKILDLRDPALGRRTLA